MTIALILAVLLGLQDKAPASTKEATKQIQFLVGKWKVTITPEGKEEGWQEMQEWQFKFNKEEWALEFAVTEGKKYKDGVLSYDLKKKLWRLDATRMDGTKIVFEGPFKAKEMILEEVAAEGAARERYSLSFLRDNRFIGSIEKRDAGSKTWLETYKYQFTKEGVPFVRSEGPKCVITGGAGTIEVAYGGKTYYVC